MTIPRVITLPGLFLAAIVCLAASLALPPRQVSAEVNPACQARFDALKASALASGSLDQAGVNNVVACLNGSSTADATAASQDTGAVLPLADVPIAPITVTIRGTLYSWSFLGVPPIVFCDTLRANGAVDGDVIWTGTADFGHYTQIAGREGWFFGSFAIVTQQSLIPSPTRWATWWGFASVSTAPCP